MKKIQKIVFICVYTFLFSALIYLGKDIFFTSALEEESFLEITHSHDEWDIHPGEEFYSFSWVTDNEVSLQINKLIYENFREQYEEQKRDKVTLRFIPSSLWELVSNSYTPITEVFLFQPDILKSINKLRVYMYQNIAETRWRMKAGDIHMFGVPQMSDEEFLGVLIHEFWHYYDIYSLPKEHFGDESQGFYDISWESVSVIKWWLSEKDFVSGYAMTNRYEDFAESYLYYILHNKDFFAKSESSLTLRRKYDFFQKYIFTKNQFYKENFASDPNRKVYYWDVTKIPVDVKKFLQYMQDEI